MIIRHVTVDCSDPFALASFWSAFTGWPVADGNGPDADWVVLEAPEGTPGLLFIRVPETKVVKNRVHLDWMPTTRTRDEEVDRARTLGATLYEDHRTPDGLGWATLRDPEGNEFCIEHHH
ncbi:MULTISPECIES: VOC family protein [Nocardia]|uniref:Glyoxalase n=1 Tax=Nocardia sputorum TaxID=2984338 RepID=A0ABN6UC08_9NOCA|nr:VOC family protein [Nocardia sputorum]BDU02824.1 glyoxalase [Nocardia sputorum]